MKLYLSFLVLCLVACHPKEAKNPVPAPTEISSGGVTTIDTILHTKNALAYIGLYQGKLPCADCAGVETTIELTEHFSYILTRKYLGRSGKKEEYKGAYKWNSTGDGIILSGLDAQPNQFTVGENTLRQLDLQGQKVRGKLEKNYILYKLSDAEADKTGLPAQDKSPKLTGIHWRLTELHGKPIKPAAKKEDFIEFLEDNSFGAFAGCNRMGGKYEFKGSTVRFFQVISTLMACPEMETEEQFKKALETTDNFVANEKVLQFRKGAVNLLKFEAVKLP